MASTVRLRSERAISLAAAEESRRVDAALAGLEAERVAARARLAGASTPGGQHEVAESLAASHRRAATTLTELAGASAIKAAVRDVADAYSGLAASAESGSEGSWNEARERVRRTDAALTDAVAAQR
jgi:hypothetical protein